jgi:leucyl/phenylalanyl-tRNA--protein transferase
MFFGESMFARRTDASKIALAALICFCREHRVPMIDCQQKTGHLASLGGREVSRAEFERRLREALSAPSIDAWTYDAELWRQLGLDSRSIPVPDPADSVS